MVTLSPQAIEKLRLILYKDYGKQMSEDETQVFGVSLLRLARLASVALARAEERRSIVKPIIN
ncbi:MAG: hypothetical protein Q7R69_01745 [bacterium]|nr:hypothetical protein [bacterium]